MNKKNIAKIVVVKKYMRKSCTTYTIYYTKDKNETTYNSNYQMKECMYTFA